MDLALRRITFSCAKKKGEGESQHIIIITSTMGKPMQEMIFILKECLTFLLISFTNVFSAVRYGRVLVSW